MLTMCFINSLKDLFSMALNNSQLMKRILIKKKLRDSQLNCVFLVCKMHLASLMSELRLNFELALLVLKISRKIIIILRCVGRGC